MPSGKEYGYPTWVAKCLLHVQVWGTQFNFPLVVWKSGGRKHGSTPTCESAGALAPSAPFSYAYVYEVEVLM